MKTYGQFKKKQCEVCCKGGLEKLNRFSIFISSRVSSLSPVLGLKVKTQMKAVSEERKMFLSKNVS